ncbi:hypothetical protein F4861DRAFT_120064 [Xylaria intraflava]|nr:hypothetical protein F4861DRAFT_120064 [Xylaria intraflava]
MTPTGESEMLPDVLPPVDDNKPVQLSTAPLECRQQPAPLLDIDEQDRDDADAISIDSSHSIPDTWGRKMLAFGDGHTIAYEAWELVLIPDRLTRRSTKSFFGIEFSNTWHNERDGCILTNPLLAFDQGDLANMHEDAIGGYKHRRGVDQRKAYEQDLANRTYKLPVDVYDKAQHLIEDKIIATNRNPHRKREWRIAVLEPREFRMTEFLPQRKRKHFFTRERRLPATRTWFIILRGEEVKSTKEVDGWRGYNQHTNPWWRLDNEETKEARSRRKTIMAKVNKPFNFRRSPRRRPVGQMPPPDSSAWSDPAAWSAAGRSII